MITMEPNEPGGKAYVRGTQTMVADILECLASGMTEQQILAQFSHLTTEGIRACLALAADRERRFTPALQTPQYSVVDHGNVDSAIESKERLRMLYDIGAQLKADQGLVDIFTRVVELTYNRLNAEESALFVLDKGGSRLLKVAAKGPSAEITHQLLELEKEYQIGESLVGRSFQAKTVVLQSQVPSAVEYYEDYLHALPSQTVRHYLGAPLIIGEDVLGVIRVINKKASEYSVADENYQISDKGFDEADVELLQTIAGQVAAAIRSAQFTEVQQYYREIVVNSPDPIIVLDRDGKIVVFNIACERVWGFSAAEVLGNEVSKYYESEEHARHIGSILRQSPTDRLQDYEARIRGRNGEIIPISLSASNLFDAQRNFIGSIGIFKDLRHSLRLQETMIQTEKLATLGKLAHTVGHEIKHDIATALNYIDTLAYECTDDDELAEIYRDVQDSLMEAIEKFQAMLMLGSPKPSVKNLVTTKEIFQKIENSLRRRAESRNIEFVIDYRSNDVGIQVDVGQLRQVLFNLFDNSMDAIDAKRHKEAGGGRGRIEVSTRVNGGHLRIRFSDDGCGISQQALSKVFVPFVTDKPHGTGLGLFIVKNIIEGHGGEILIESKEGEGTTVGIAIPFQAHSET